MNNIIKDYLNTLSSYLQTNSNECVKPDRFSCTLKLEQYPNTRLVLAQTSMFCVISIHFTEGAKRGQTYARYLRKGPGKDEHTPNIMNILQEFEHIDNKVSHIKIK